eukprot:TRINITY_DN72399_c0_g1_i1.p1 TRINITY_DN72399_c0_g1~~TRINITY_DN72399_c0_g1_i1.p1  ORF type:complete len:562 (+),score=81.55 TRINITY_DN72399_c0_g1_i1:51-1688(+)
MTQVALPFCVFLATSATCIFGQTLEAASLQMDDECHGEDADGEKCSIDLLQSKNNARVVAHTAWVDLVEGTECRSLDGITCVQAGGWRYFKFPAGEFSVSKQVSIPKNTVIEGIANPNDKDKTKKPDYRSQTVFVASGGVSDQNACYCQNLERTWEPQSPSNPYHCSDLTSEQVTSMRKGFLMSSNTLIKNIAFQGKDTLRPSDNGALCGGAVFETPGCVHNRCKFPHLVTGDGKPVNNVSIENVRLNDYLGNTNLASQLAVWTAMTSDTQTPTSNVRVKNLVAMFLHADGINFHGFTQNAIVDDSYIQNTGDDIYAVWGNNFDTRGIVFQNSVAVDAGRARHNHYGSCVAIYGAKEATFRNLTCYAPEQNTRDCYDSKHGGETCNGCLGIIKESFDADYSGSQFTFVDNKFYKLKRWQHNGQQVYDLTSPQPTGRPEICNNEWKKGGLNIIGGSGSGSGGSSGGGGGTSSYMRLGGVAVNEGSGVGSKSGCDLSCCKKACTAQKRCNSFAWSAKFASCFLKDAVLQKDSAVRADEYFTTYIKNR